MTVIILVAEIYRQYIERLLTPPILTV